MGEDVVGRDPWVDVGRRVSFFGGLHERGLVPDVPCLACGYPTLAKHGGRHVCVVCHWQDDGTTRVQPDRPSDLNDGLTLREAAGNVAESGVAVAALRVISRPAFFLPDVRAARADLVAAYERLGSVPRDVDAQLAVTLGRSRLMRAIVNEMR